MSHFVKRNTDLSFLAIIGSKFPPSLEFSSMSRIEGELGRNSHVSQSVQQRQPPQTLSSPAGGERSYGSRAQECCTLTLYSERVDP